MSDNKETYKLKRRLEPESVKAKLDPDRFSFTSTEDLDPLQGTIGQERGIRAIQFSLSHGIKGFNCYVSGAIGTGKMTAVMSLVSKRADGEKSPLDWIYVYNFEKPDEPLSIAVKNGTARQLASAMDDFVKACRADIPKAFSSEEYLQERNKIEAQFEPEKEKLSNALTEEAKKRSFAIQRGATGLVTIPIKDGKPLEQKAFEVIPEEEQKKVRKNGQELTEIMNETLNKMRAIEEEQNKTLLEYDRKVAYYILDMLISKIVEQHKDEVRLNKFFNWVKRDIVKHLELFKKQADKESVSHLLAVLERYKINLFVDNSKCQGAPVVFEDNPNYYNLFGAIEYRNVNGNMVTNFSKIKPGAVHMANGGYLIIPARELVSAPYAWEALKRTLLSNEAKIENISEKLRGGVIETLKPSPIPVDFKVILVGSPHIYALLHDADQDFRRLFKVRADFDVDMPRNAENELAYARFVAARCKSDGLRPFDKGAIASMIEWGSRLAEDQKRLSTRFLDISDLASEASFWAMDANSPLVRAEHVNKALEEKFYRSRMIEEKLQEMMVRGIILINVDGEQVGQLNGLTVMSLGDYSFGKPVKITARTWLGKRGVLQIERETRMSGPIHNKGVLTITGFLGGKFAKKRPLPLSASLTFEQLYSEVEGDSASSTELYALLSSLTGIPLTQSIAVTGSVNQYGIIQPIGGANEKIEGFFRLCKTIGLTGKQGVMLPKTNIENLMLKDEVVEAIKENKFHIYAVSSIDEGIEILTAKPAAEVYAKVEDVLNEMYDNLNSHEAKD